MEVGEARRLSAACSPAMDGLGLTAPAADRVRAAQIAGLWAGMGSIVELAADRCDPIIVKRIRPGACASLGDQRKKASYEVEANFYSPGGAADALAAFGARAPRALRVERDRAGVTICMTKLPGAMASRVGDAEARAALAWLARLHGRYFGRARARAAAAALGLQPRGTYWYLATRPDEHAAMSDRGWEGRLKRAARAIDARLAAEPLAGVVHGDAKAANLALGRGADGALAAAFCDFQYTGAAAVACDLAYFLCCAADDAAACAGGAAERALLAGYCEELARAAAEAAAADAAAGGDAARLPPPTTPPPSPEALRDSLDLAFCDLARWMAGWGTWGNDLSARVGGVLDRLDGGRDLGSEEAYDEAVRRVFPLPA